MARPKKDIEQVIIEPNPIQQWIDELVEFYDKHLIDKHPNQLIQLFEAGKTYPNYQDTIQDLIKHSSMIAYKVCSSLAFKQITGL